MITAHEYHARYCRCGGANDADVEAVTELNQREREVHAAFDAGVMRGYFGASGRIPLSTDDPEVSAPSAPMSE